MEHLDIVFYKHHGKKGKVIPQVWLLWSFVPFPFFDLSWRIDRQANQQVALTDAAFRQRKNEFLELAKKLIEHVDQVKIALENCNLSCRQLETKELIELFYNIYNPLSARNEKIPELEKLDLMPGNAILPQFSS